MRRHLDVDEFRRHRLESGLGQVLPPKPGKHQLFVGVFVIDHEKAVTGGISRARHRDIPEKIVIIAELQALGGGILAERVEWRRARQHRVAPSDQHVGVVAFGNVVTLVNPGADFREIKARRVIVMTGEGARHRIGQGRDDDRAERATKDVALMIARGDHVSDGRVVRRAAPDIVGRFIGLRAGERRHGCLGLLLFTVRIYSLVCCGVVTIA